MDINPSLLVKIKNSIRITHNKLDEDVNDTIAAALADLKVCGIRPEKLNPSQELAPLILTAVKLYCKKEYVDDPAKAARFQEGYDSLKACLMMSEGYGGEGAGSDE